MRSLFTRKRALRATLALAVLATSVGVGAQWASAVHDDGDFELDGNATAGAADGDDWSDVYAATSGEDCDMPAPVVACSFAHDANNTSIFTTGGSKDELDLPSWRHTDGSVPDKDDLLDAFAVRYDDGNLYFGADRKATNGDAQIGFWFFQNDVGLNGNGTFSGEHEVGDILVLSNFSNGGTVPNIRVFEWLGVNNVQLLPGIPLSAACTPASTDDPACAITSGNGVPSPWPFAPKSGTANQFGSGAFFEGGIDLGFLGLGDECFSSFLVETRASTSITSTLKDFVLGDFDNCGSTTTTTPQDSSGTDITTISIGDGSVDVHDHAVVTGTGAGGTPPPPTGSVKFYLCGPTPGIQTCDSSGTVVSTNALPGTTNPGEVDSDDVSITQVGDYCFFAEYSGDANYPASDDGGSPTECFTVTPRQPSISTNASAQNGVALGTAINDTATLSGTTDNAGGTITFKAYGPDDATCSGAAAFTSAAIAVNGPGNYGSGDFTPTAPGTYRWIASYSGDTNNDPVSGACNDVGEASIIISLTPTIATDQSFIPNDAATISVAAGGGNLAGNVIFKLHKTADCSDAAVYTQTIAVAGASPQTRGTSNTGGPGGYVVQDSANLYWQVTYDSTNPAHQDVVGDCGVEHSELTITDG